MSRNTLVIAISQTKEKKIAQLQGHMTSSICAYVFAHPVVGFPTQDQN